jgi:signal transduction histidine kinase
MAPADVYQRESQRLCRQAAATACFLGIPLVPAFAVLDRVVFPAHFVAFLEMRLTCVATLAVILWLLRRPFGERHALGLGMLVAIDVGLMIDAMAMMTGGHASPYYAGVNLVILTVALVMPWAASWTAVTCAILVGGYVAGAVAAGPITEGRTFVNNLFFLATTTVIAVVGAAGRDGYRRREFSQRQALTAALRHRDEFVAKMTHELRTPIHVMVGYADILLEDTLPGGESEARALVQRIRSHGVLLRGLVSDLLDYSKMEAGKMEVRRAPVVVRHLVDQVAESFRPLSERKGLRLRVLHGGEIPTVVSDEQKIRQILDNLVGNALKFTDRGEITIGVSRRVETAPLREFVFLAEPAADVRRDGVLVQVSDTGIGIREEDIRTLAADFQQVDADAAARGGTGLGLSISKKLVQLLGGWLAVRSRHGAGATFAVFLPSLEPGEIEEGDARRSAA